MVESSGPHTLDVNSGILVVDDNASNLLAINVALGELDEDVVQAQSGAEALRCLLARDFALILLDVQMPSMDGFETARLIRQREHNRHTPIIFITAHSYDNEDTLQAYAMGAVDFLFKPIVPEVLRAKASVLISLQRRTALVAEQARLLRMQERRLHEQELAERERRWEQEALRRQMEEKSRVAQELARRAEELKQTIAERQVAQERLAETNRRLAESDQRKDEFLAVLAHELRNPLAPIVTSLDLLDLLHKQGRAAPERVESTCAVMRRQVLHLSRLVDDLLDVSRISSGKIQLATELLELTPLVEDAVATSRHLLEQHQQTLTLDLDKSPIWLMADPVRIAQVISNLLNNASRYTPKGGQIRVETAIGEGRAYLRVADTGQGIPEEMIESIFDTFVQFKAKGGGLGLGLTLVRRLVELHGGEVVARSRGLGRGSEFEVALPIAEGSVDEAGRDSVPARVDGALNLVVIEDHADIRDMVALLLTSQGHTVRCAGTGADGAALCVSERPDAALVDIGLDDLDGYQVARQVCSTLGAEAPYLIAMTGFGQARDKRRAFDAGFKAHLIKPATADAIARVLASVPPRRSVSQAAERGRCGVS